MRNYLHYCYLILIVLILTVLTEQQAQASRAQVMGGDISYWCVDTNEYKFAVNLYYYCVEEGIAPIPQISLQVVSKTLGIEDTLILLPSIKKEVTPVCSAYKDSTSCQNPNSKYPGVKQHIYHSYGKSITLSAADDWTISFVENGRNLDNNNGITNLDTTTVSADKDLFYLYAKINNSNPTQCTDSLAFATSPIPFYCNNTAAEFKQGVTHSSINGNYLKYTSINPLAEGATAITYQSGFNENQPLEAHTYHFDPRTGDINFTPTYWSKNLLKMVLY